MKPISLIAISLFLGLFLVSCADKKAFKATEVKEAAGLVYIYVEEDSNVDDTFGIVKYDVLINGNKTSESLKAGEYIKLDVKPQAIAISLARNDLDIHTIKLNPQAGETYYLRGQSYSTKFGAFDFKLVDSSKGQEEILSKVSSTEYAIKGDVLNALVSSDESSKNTSKMSEDEINAMIEKKLKAMKSTQVNSTQASPTATTSTSATGSKLEDIRNAYEMKKQGVLTDEEFQKMKSEILAK